MEHVPEYGHKHQQQRENGEERVEGDHDREVACLVVTELLDGRGGNRRPAMVLLGRFDLRQQRLSIHVPIDTPFSISCCCGAQVSTEALLERSDESSVLRDAIAKVGAGTGQLVLLEGPAGIGKTALLEQARDAAAQSGMEVLSARGLDLEREFAFGVARQLFEGLVTRADPDRQGSYLPVPRRWCVRCSRSTTGMGLSARSVVRPRTSASS